VGLARRCKMVYSKFRFACRLGERDYDCPVCMSTDWRDTSSSLSWLDAMEIII
jgi:hypothetical protein